MNYIMIERLNVVDEYIIHNFYCSVCACSERFTGTCFGFWFWRYL